MAADIYENGSVLTQGGGLQVTDTKVVKNLNASQVQGKEPKDFIQIGSDYGLSQTDKTIEITGVSVSNTSTSINFDANSAIKIGNVIIKSSDSGNGILIGIE